ncbi:30719_t:CDS:2, partial [Racocetra persica]
EARKRCKLQEINEQLNDIDYKQLKFTGQMIKKFNESTVLEKKHSILISEIEQLPSKQITATTHLFEKMRYSQGSNKGEILSPHLQIKALNYIDQNFYKPS